MGGPVRGDSAMKYLRSKAKRLSLLALLALALQLGLSFGHCHHDIAAAAVPAAASPSHTSAPDTDHDQDTHRDLCAICASMAMAHTVVAATAPPLPAPLIFSRLETAHSSEASAPDSRRGAFQSRAPPRSSLE